MVLADSWPTIVYFDVVWLKPRPMGSVSLVSSSRELAETIMVSGMALFGSCLSRDSSESLNSGLVLVIDPDDMKYFGDLI